MVLGDLAAGRPIAVPTLVVVAHPDDDTLGMGGRLAAFELLTIMQLTDGAPRDCIDARRLGFSSWQTYSAEREREASHALAALGLSCPRVCCDVPDQESIFHLPELVASVERGLRTAALVFTHPYEGGHPDHDTAALSVQMACDRISLTGRAPPTRLEFASYHHRDGRMVTGQFWSDENCPAISLQLDRVTEARKCRALAEYRTQARVLDWFCTGLECYRVAPRYDFTQPPPPGIAQYDFFGWPISAARWLESARATVPNLQEMRR
jgi:N-acetylglucosamine malate deacetylase 2